MVDDPLADDLDRAASGDEQAWAQAYARFLPALERVAREINADAHAELSGNDLIQE